MPDAASVHPIDLQDNQHVKSHVLHISKWFDIQNRFGACGRPAEQ